MSFATIEKCYAVMWSYGEICVHCNCCGRYDNDEISVLEARLKYHKELLQQHLNFDSFVTGKKFKKYRHIQGINNLKSIRNERAKINILMNRLNQLKK